MNVVSTKWYHLGINAIFLHQKQGYLHFISFPQFIYDSFHISLTLISFTGTYEPIIDLLSNVSGFIAQLVEYRTGIARSRVQTPLKS